MEMFTQYLVLVFVLSLLFGIFAQVGKFCLLGGLRSVYKRQSPHRFWVYFVAMVVAVLASSVIEFYQLMDLNSTKPPYRSANFAYGRYILGGLIFGVGMVLSSGCGMRNLIRTGEGSLQAFISIIIMALSAYAMINLSVYSEYFLPIVKPLAVTFKQASSQDLGALLATKQNAGATRLIIALVLFFVVTFLALRNQSFRQAKFLISAFGIGLIIAAGFYLTGGDFGQVLIEEADFMAEPPRGLATQSFSFAAPMADTIYALVYREGLSVITFGVVAVLGLPIGAFISSIVRKEFKISGITNSKKLSTHVIGAILVGIGSVLAMGCTIGHGLTGISTLALGSFLALASIIFGAFMTLKFQSNL